MKKSPKKKTIGSHDDGMERICFLLPNHPTRGKQHIVVEQPCQTSVWYLVLTADKAKPLVGFNEAPTSAKQVLDEFAKEYGKNNVAQFVMQGYSLVNMVCRF